MRKAYLRPRIVTVTGLHDQNFPLGFDLKFSKTEVGLRVGDIT